MKKLFFVLFSLASFYASAQSLPNIQKTSIRSPVNIKIDGKATEWDGRFQAYNKATDIYYTLSNDDENIYFTIQAKYHDISDKILRGGISLIINHTLNKKDGEHIIVAYPVYSASGQSDVTNMLARKENAKRDVNGADVAVDDLNKVLDANSKTIRLSGIKDITDKEISVYNEEGIKAAAQFDKQLWYTYELAIPIKYLALPNNGADAFGYNIKINEPEDVHPSRADGPPPPPMIMTSIAVTDFWGEYTLAKK